MTDTHVESLQMELAGLPYGPSHRDKATQLLAIAQERGDRTLEFDARMRLIEDGVMSGITDLALANFAWCAAAYREEPSMVTDDGSRAYDFFWAHKWMPGIVSTSPAFDREQIAAVLDDMERTFREAGLEQSAVVTSRFETATHLGDLEEADRLGAQLRELPRDRYSSCEACVPSDYMHLELLRGDAEAAVEIAVKTWRDGQTCAEEPETMLAHVLVPMLATGRSEDAVEAFEVVRSASSQDPERFLAIALAAQFASVTGNHDLALGLVERHLPWFAHDALDERAHMVAAMAFAVVLDRYSRARDAHGVEVRSSADPALAAVLAPVEAPRTVAELAGALWELGESLAARFDARNGNDVHARDLARARELVGAAWEIPLGGERFAPVTIRRAQPQSAHEWLVAAIDASLALDATAASTAAAQVLMAPQASPVMRLRAASIRAQAGRALGDEESVRSGHAALVQAASELDDATAQLAAVVAADAGPQDLAAAAVHHRDALPSLRARVLGRAAQDYLDLQARSEAGVTQEDVEWAFAALDEAREAVGSLDEHGLDGAAALDASLGHWAHTATRVQILGRLGDLDAAMAALDDALPLAGQAAAGAREGMRAGLLEASGAPQEAMRAHDRAATAYAAAGFPATASRAAFGAGRCALQSGEPELAVQRIEYGASLLDADQSLEPTVRWDLATALVASGEADRALPHIDAVLEAELYSPHTTPAALAQTRMLRARALVDTWGPDAAEEYVQAARLQQEAGDLDAAIEASLRAARTWCDRGEPALAIGELDQTARLLEAGAEPILTLALLEIRAECLCDLADERWRDALAQARAHGAALDDPDRAVTSLLRCASWLMYAEEDGVALELLEDARGRAATLEDDQRWVDATMGAARALTNLEREAQAYAMLSEVRARAAGLSEPSREVARSTGLGILDDLGRESEYEQWLEALS